MVDTNNDPKIVRETSKKANFRKVVTGKRTTWLTQKMGIEGQVVTPNVIFEQVVTGCRTTWLTQKMGILGKGGYYQR